MPDLFIYDTVRTKDGGILGTVERTHLDNASDTLVLEDFPIICWVRVPDRVIYEFAASVGTPPQGYVFVVAAEDSQGAFLAAVDDLELVSRSFEIGDSVKRQDGLLGTVVDVDDTYDISQLIRLEGGGPKHFSQLGPEAPPYSIADVPSRELKAAEEVLEDDFVSYKSWLGVVKETALTVIIQLEDNSVVALKNKNIFVPIPREHEPLKLRTSYYDHRDRSDPKFDGFSRLFLTSHPRVGSLVVVYRSTIKHGRWLSGPFNPVPSRGRPRHGLVLAVLPARVTVDWVAHNPFAPSTSGGRPMTSLAVYENIDSFKRGDELRILPDLKLIDLSRPAELPSTQPAEPSARTNSVNSLHPGLKVGDSVYFRDAARAAIKYPADATNAQGFDRIDCSLTNGWDVNTFRVTSRKQMVRVRWHDGSESVVNSNELSRFVSFEDDVRPGDITVERAGLKMKMLSSDTTPFVDFNEMKFFETPCHLKPRRVGVIQSVDAHDRVATVRWFRHPQLVLTEGGTALTEDSNFGRIGDEIEECSMYEIMKFPALNREYRDLVIIPPPSVLQACGERTQSGESRIIRMLVNDQLRDSGRHQIPDAQSVLNAILARSEEITVTGLSQHSGTELDDITNIDWAGEIISLGLDGTITVRLSGAHVCRDQTLDFDLVVANLNVDDLLGSDGEESDGTEMEYDQVISQSIEYEGGKRVDNDPDDENWESVEEEGSSNTEGKEDEDVDMTDAPEEQKPPELAPDLSSEPPSFYSLLRHIPFERPPSFAILDIEPPADQHQAHTGRSNAPASSSAFLKRIQHEHRMLSTSLPPTIYVRGYESNLSLLRCLIIGPADTPYENAPFLIDLVLPPSYPAQPPTAHFHSWTSGLGRINPNLYEEGKICLSLLGTWPGRESKESWSESATLLQLLVSIQGLIMVKKPFFNEAGLEDFANDPHSGYETESAQYNEKAYVMARRFVSHALTQTPAGIQDILAWLYFPPPPIRVAQGPVALLYDVLNRGHAIITASQEARNNDDSATSGSSQQLLDGAGRISPIEGFLRPLSRGAIVMLSRLLNELGDCLVETTRQTRREKEN
ncbi:hypothetical protein DV735_g4185, partial [Chaetothyriales sp. CBS 134920]